MRFSQNWGAPQPCDVSPTLYSFLEVTYILLHFLDSPEQFILIPSLPPPHLLCSARNGVVVGLSAYSTIKLGPGMELMLHSGHPLRLLTLHVIPPHSSLPPSHICHTLATPLSPYIPLFRAPRHPPHSAGISPFLQPRAIPRINSLPWYRKTTDPKVSMEMHTEKPNQPTNFEHFLQL